LQGFRGREGRSGLNRHLRLYSPEQNGMIERLFRTLKEECLWHHRFISRDDALVVIAAWLEKYHTERPHSALGYLTPKEFAKQLAP
jgi:putative transposase